MKPTAITKTCKLPDGREITIETGKLARQADGSVVLRMGNTMLLASVVSALLPKKEQTSCRFPLTTRKNLHPQGKFRVVL